MEREKIPNRQVRNTLCAKNKQMTTNPWLNIPASDYEGHMGLPSVNQLSFLNKVFREAILNNDSSSIAYLGCATGNGLEYINPRNTKHITAIDINSEYLAILSDRYKNFLPNLEIIEADLNFYEGKNKEFTLIFAGLIFEYLAPEPLLRKIRAWLKDDGVLVTVLQLQDQNIKMVSDTPYTSLHSLTSIMIPVSINDFKLIANKAKMQEVKSEIIVLESGKSFYVASYKNCYASKGHRL